MNDSHASQAHQVVDAQQRAAALDPTRSFIVQAPAGSGKTELLTQRTLALLQTVQAPEEVIAITFTRKAAGEMRARIMQALSRAAQGEHPRAEHERMTLDLAGRVLAQSRKHGWELESSPARLRIQTIDSLSSGLVSRMPLLSRLGGPGQISKDPEAMYMQAARTTVAELDRDSPWTSSVQTLLRHLDNDLDKACDLIAGMLPQREQWLRHLADRSNRRLQKHRLEQALERAVEEALSEARELIPDQEAEQLLRLADFAASRLPDPEKVPGLGLCADLKDLPDCLSQELPVWLGLARLCLTGSGQLRKRADKNLGFPAPSSSKDPELKVRYQGMKEEFAACMQALSAIPGLEHRLNEIRFLPGPEYSQAQWTVLEALFDVLRLAAGHLHLVFQERGEVDFAEISSRAQMALGPPQEPTDLALVLDHAVQHLLMDEFQDTSISQFLLLQSLTAGWTPGDGRTFFAVGDPMQSIYSFREAEVGLFLRARESGLGHIPLHPLTLSVNFRSQAGIVDWVNQAFPQVLPEEEDPLTGSVPYSPAHAFLPRSEPPAVCVHPFFDPDPGPEARTVISLIQEASQRDPQGTTAVLVRSRPHLQAIMPELRRAGLRFQAVDIDPLSQRPAIQDLCSLAKALRHPGHNLAWLAVLRAPWCGLDLEDLHLLAGDADSPSVLSQILDDGAAGRLSRPGQNRLGRVKTVLAHALEQRDRAGVRRQVESCWLALGGPDCLHDDSERQDAEIFFRLLQERFESAPDELTDELDQAVDRLFAQPDTQADQSLQVMTMHKAKGLEFDTVILPGMGRTPRPDERQILAWLERSGKDGRSDLLLAPRTGTGEEADPVYNYIQRLNQQKSRHEDGRLLYVAATRARKRLHILGHTSLNEDGRPRQPGARSLLAALWPAVREEFEHQAGLDRDPDPEPEHRSQQPPSQVLTRLTPNWQPPELPAGLKPSVPLKSDPEHQDLAFDWAGEVVRCAGTCVHGWLLVVARQGLDAWDASRVQGLRPVFARQLSDLGMLQSDLEQGVELVEEALINTLAHHVGRWILAPRQEAGNEYALSGLDQGRVTSVVMDRTFVDEKGNRWIIDYKTSRHEGTDLEAFLEQERVRYQGQMATYARLMQARDPRPIRVGLYFPLLSGWLEWGVS